METVVRRRPGALDQYPTPAGQLMIQRQAAQGGTAHRDLHPGSITPTQQPGPGQGLTCGTKRQSQRLLPAGGQAQQPPVGKGRNNFV